MVKAIIRHEWRVLRADHSLYVLVVLLVGICAFAVHVGRDWIQHQQARLAQAAADEQARIEAVESELLQIESGGQPASAFANPRLAGVVGNRAARNAALPIGLLAGLAVGQSDLYPQFFRISHFTSARTFLCNGDLENPHNLLAGRFDFAFVIVFLLPLLILAVSYNLIAGEKEDGTLALALSQPVSLSRLLLGKLALRALLLIGLALLLATLGALATGVQFNQPFWPRLAGLCAVIVLYGGFWFSLAAGINGLARSSAFNATALAAAWLLLVVVVPALSQLLAASLYPAPSRVELVGLAREASAAATTERSRLLARYYEDHPEMLGSMAPDPANFAALGYVTQEEVNRRIQPVLDRFDAQLARQQELVRRVRFLSPAILAHEALNDLAGTGEYRFADFRAQANRFGNEWKAFIVPHLLQADTMRPGVTAALPVFRYHEEALSALGARLLAPLFGLLLLALLVATIASRTVQRYRMTAGS